MSMKIVTLAEAMKLQQLGYAVVCHADKTVTIKVEL